MSLTEEGMRKRKWGSYEVLGMLLENQEALLSCNEKADSYQASIYHFDIEYWSDCLDIHRRLRCYADRLIQSESSPSLVNKNFIALLELDLEQLEYRIRAISSQFTEVGDDIEILRDSILRKIHDRKAPK
jgi:hypothetical protein